MILSLYFYNKASSIVLAYKENANECELHRQSSKRKIKLLETLLIKELTYSKLKRILYDDSIEFEYMIQSNGEVAPIIVEDIQFIFQRDSLLGNIENQE